jgi:hypothetical protein
VNVGIQTPDVINTLEQLNLADASLELPAINPADLNAVYPIEAGWVRKGDIAWNTATISLNGLIYTATDLVDSIIRYDAEQQGAILVGRNRFYSYIVLEVDGGTVNPLEFTLKTNIPGVLNIVMAQVSIPNPGAVAIGPIFIPAGLVLAINNSVNGGAGDTVNISCLGVQAPPGVPIPLMPPPRTLFKI